MGQSSGAGLAEHLHLGEGRPDGPDDDAARLMTTLPQQREWAENAGAFLFLETPNEHAVVHPQAPRQQLRWTSDTDTEVRGEFHSPRFRLQGGEFDARRYGCAVSRSPYFPARMYSGKVLSAVGTGVSPRWVCLELAEG